MTFEECRYHVTNVGKDWLDKSYMKERADLCYFIDKGCYKENCPLLIAWNEIGTLKQRVEELEKRMREHRHVPKLYI